MKYIIYGAPGCSFCSKAKILLEMHRLEYVYKEVGTELSKEQLEQVLGRKVTTVPQIVKMADGFGEYIGGFTELQNSLN